ncbi:MAG: hypothetical protein B6I22_08600 [Desulfobacteraceae bacterium 4572_123]|nr:MAG: hypothetical protein B6I22_08600 [Desulfobacteraceae bacterium 4572_123]
MKQLLIKKTVKNKILKVLSKKIRACVITAMIVLVALTAVVDNCLKEIKILQLIGGTDDITLFENNFEHVRRILPPFGVIGYYSDKKYDARTFFMTIYTLSPRIVVRKIEHPFVIGNFSRFTNPGEFAESLNLSIVRTVDKNIVLFEKRSK